MKAPMLGLAFEAQATSVEGEEKRISLRIKERTQEKRFDVRGQMDDDHHEQKRKIKYLKNSEFPSSTLVLS